MLSKGLQFACFAFLIFLVRTTTTRLCRDTGGSGNRLHFILRLHVIMIILMSTFLTHFLFSAWKYSETPQWRQDEQVASHFNFLWLTIYQKCPDTQTWNPYVLVYIKHFISKTLTFLKRLMLFNNF